MITRNVRARDITKGKTWDDPAPPSTPEPEEAHCLRAKKHGAHTWATLAGGGWMRCPGERLGHPLGRWHVGGVRIQ